MTDINEPLDAEPLNAGPMDTGDDDAPSEPTKPLGGLRRVLAWALVLLCIVAAVNALTVAAYTALNAADAPFPAAEEAMRQTEQLYWIDTASPWISRAFYATFIVAMVCYLRFVYRAMDNVKKFSASYVAATPGGSVVWHFVPFINWIKPYQIMLQLWTRSHGSGSSMPQVAGFWWAAWLGVNFAGWIASIWNGMLQQQAAEGIFDVDLFIRTNAAVVLGNVSLIAASILLMPLTKGIASAQDSVEQARVFDD